MHDIGKNLVKTILSNNGYQVIDLGKQVPAETIISKAVEVNADAIGLERAAGQHQQADAADRQRAAPPRVEVPGADRRGSHQPPLWPAHPAHRAGRILRAGRVLLQGCLRRPVDHGRPDEPGTAPERCSHATARRKPSWSWAATARPSGRSRSAPVQRSQVAPAPRIPTPPSWGPRVVRQMPLEMVFKHLSKNELFRLSWGAKNTHGEEWEKLEAEFDDRLEQHAAPGPPGGLAQARRQSTATGPAQSDGDDLVIYDPKSRPGDRHAAGAAPLHTSPASPPATTCAWPITSPRSTRARWMWSPSRWSRWGRQATERFDRLQAAGDYTEAYFTHGLAVQTAEATADYLHRHIRRELGLAPEQGKRYSWGYPAIPELDDHPKVFQLLPAEASWA